MSNVPESVINAAKAAWGDQIIVRLGREHYVPPVRDGGATDQCIRLIAPVIWDARGQVTPDLPTEEELHSALVGVLSNASNFPAKAQFQILGQDMRPLRDKCVAAILALFSEKGTP